MIKKIKIYDLDGTLIDSSHRYRTDKTGERIDLNFWRENDIPEMIAKDSFLTLKKWLDEDLQRKDTYVIFATARACVEGDANYKYLKEHNVWPDKFIHRQGVNDNRGGAELKLAAIKPLLNLKQFKKATIHIFEDNLSYLEKMTKAVFNMGRPVVGHYIPSNQGH